MGRLIGTTTQYSFLPGQTFTNAYTYDAASNRTGFTAPDGSTNTYTYDTLNRLNGLTNSWAGAFGFSYDALSRRTQLTRPNGVNTNYSYDSLSRLLSVLHQTGTTTLDGDSYTYDLAGNRTSKTNYLNGVTEGYTYDPLYELTQVVQGTTTTESYSYDAVGNRLSSLTVPAYNYNSSNELTSDSTGSDTYDANGNTLSDPSGKQFTWDFENRLIQAVVPGTGTVTFKYDPFGRRIQKAGSSGAMNYLYDGAQMSAEITNTGSIDTSYLNGLKMDQPLAELGSGNITYYQSDAINSISSLTNSNGNIVGTYIYDVFGNLSQSTGAVVNTLRYAGREFDSETGIYYNRARYYNSQRGRFISEDPAGFATNVNFYPYATNNPVNLSDPLGLFTIKDNINKHSSADIDPECGEAAGACTIIKAALVVCDCKGCPGNWKATAQLRIYGDIYTYGGPFPYKGRHPKDKSVHDGPSAIAHEYSFHINPSIMSVTPMINALEGKTFGSKEECIGECNKTSKIVNELFRRTLADTQQKEDQGGSF